MRDAEDPQTNREEEKAKLDDSIKLEGITTVHGTDCTRNGAWHRLYPLNKCVKFISYATQRRKPGNSSSGPN